VICCSAVRVSARTECEERGVIPAPPNQILTQVPPGAGAHPAGGAPHGPPHNSPPLPEGAPPMAFMQALLAAWQQYNATVGGAPPPMGFPGVDYTKSHRCNHSTTHSRRLTMSQMMRHGRDTWEAFPTESCIKTLEWIASNADGLHVFLSEFALKVKENNWQGQVNTTTKESDESINLLALPRLQVLGNAWHAQFAVHAGMEPRRILELLKRATHDGGGYLLGAASNQLTGKRDKPLFE